MVAPCRLSLLCVFAVLLLVTKTKAFSADANAAMARMAPEHELEGNEWNRVKTIISEGFDGIVNVFANPHQNQYQSRSHSRQMNENVYYGYDYYDKIFVVILYFFFGYILDLKKVKSGLKKPFGPGIAAFVRWIYAPLVSWNNMLKPFFEWFLTIQFLKSKSSAAMCWPWYSLQANQMFNMICFCGQFVWWVS